MCYRYGCATRLKHGGHFALGFTHNTHKVDISKTNHKHKVDNMASVNKPRANRASGALAQAEGA